MSLCVENLLTFGIGDSKYGTQVKIVSNNLNNNYLSTFLDLTLSKIYSLREAVNFLMLCYY